MTGRNGYICKARSSAHRKAVKYEKCDLTMFARSVATNIYRTRWLPGFARVPCNASSPCHMHPIISAIT